MRVISGIIKGKKFNFIKSSITRPLKDSVRENIFNILAHSNKFNLQLEGSKVLDLYSGVGSFGIECISREAKQVSFVEKNVGTYQILLDNLDKLNITHKARTFNQDIYDFLKIKKNTKYNIFFFDPPFSYNHFLKILKIIREKYIFDKDHIVIIHREKKSINNFQDFIKIILTKEYGRSKIFFGVFTK